MDLKYSHEDWLKGYIRRDVELGVIDSSNFTTSNYSFYLLREMFEKELIDKEDFRIIEKLTFSTFSRGSQLSISLLTEEFTSKFEQAPYPDELLDFEIKDIEKRLGKIRDDIQKQVLEGKWSPKDITEIEVGNYVQAKKQKRVLHISNPSPLPHAENDGSIFEMLEATVKDINDAVSGTSYKSENIGNVVRKYLANHRDNKLYDATVLKGYLRNLLDLKSSEKEGSIKKVKGKQDYPLPSDVAEKFINQSKNKNTSYTKADYEFVMTIARDNPEIKSYKELTSLARNHEDSTVNIKTRKDSEDYKTEMRWIKFYDKEAGITRK